LILKPEAFDVQFLLKKEVLYTGVITFRRWCRISSIIPSTVSVSWAQEADLGDH